MKYSKSALGLLNAQYRSVLRKCLLINLGLFALGAVAANPANASEYTERQTVGSGEEATYSGDSFTGIAGALINNGTVNINNGTTFSGNTTVNGGAAIRNNSSGILNVDDTTFSDNIGTLSSGSYLYGTAIWNNGGKISITNSTFTGNEALKGPQPRAYSSAIFNGAGNLTIENTKFVGNYGEYMGGVIQANGGSTVKLTNTTFDSNNIKDGQSSGASTVLANGATMNIKDTAFKNNYGVDADSSSNDEGIFNAQGAAKIKFSGTTTFENNHASAVGVNNYNNPEVTFVAGGTNIFSGNTAKNGAAVKNYKAHNGYTGAITFENATTNTFEGNTTTNNGGAIYNGQEITFKDGSSATFIGNTADGLGGAVYNAATGVINFNGTSVFSRNTANGESNDIYNLGTIAFNSGNASIEGGIDGSDGIINIAGGTVNVANALKNQTVNATAGELALNNVDLTSTTVAINSGAALNSIDNAINTYVSNVTLNNGAGFSADFNADGESDKYAATANAGLILKDINLLSTWTEIGAAAAKTYTVADGANITADGVLAYKDGYKFSATGNSDNSGKVTITNNGQAFLNEAVGDTEAGTHQNVTYDLASSEVFNTTDNTIDSADMTIKGSNNASVTLDNDMIVSSGSSLSVENTTFAGSKTLENKDGAVLNILDSNINVNVNNAGTMYSDPTTYTETVTNSGTATFDGDTFASTATLANSGTANFVDTTFEQGSVVNGNGSTGTLNFTGGTTKLGATVVDNSLNIQNGATLQLTDGGNIDNLALSNDTNGGTIDLRNNRIDTLANVTLNSDLSILLDANLNTHEADSVSGAITDTAGTNSMIVNAIELLALSGNDTETVNLATASNADKISVSAAAEKTLKTYYANVDYNSTTGVLTLSSKNPYASTDLVGSWGSGNYIKAYDANNAPETSVGANLTILDNQVYTNEQNIATNTTDISTLNTWKTNLATANGAADAVHGSNIIAGTVAKTALASGVQTSLGLADSAVQSIISGTTNGTISVDGTDVAVKGLDTAAYAKTTDFATAAQGVSADAAYAAAVTNKTDTVASGNTNLITSNGVYTNAKNANYNTAAGTNIAANSTIATAINSLDTTIGDMSSFGSNTYATSTTSVATNLDNLDTAIANRTVTVNTGTGVATITDGSTTADVYTTTQSDAKYVQAAANNTFTGNNTFNGTVTMTNGLTVSGGTLTTNSVTLNGQLLANVDSGASAITSGSANTVATTATVLKSAENATFTPTGNIAATTIKDAIAELDNEKINTSAIATSLTSSSTDAEVASAKAVYDGLADKQDTLSATNKLDTNFINWSSAQSDALSSGITAAKVGQYDDAYAAAVTNKTDTVASGNTNLITSNGVYTNAKNANYNTAAGTNIAANSTIAAAIDSLDTAIGDRKYVTSRSYAGSLLADDQDVATSILNVATQTDVNTARFAGFTTGQTVAQYVTANAAGATYDNTTSGLTATTIQSAIDEVNGSVGNAQTEIDNAETALGVLTATGTYDNTVLTSNYYKTPSTGAVATTLSGALNNMATNLEYITGGSITGTGAVSNNYTISSVAYGTPTATTSLAQAIGQISNNIGSAITGTTRAASSMSTVAGNSVNANIQALDTAIGGDATGTYVSSTASVNANISTLDSTIGNMSGFGSNHYATNTTSVAANLSALDGQVYANKTTNDTQNAGLGNLANAVGVSYTASSGAVGSTTYSSNNYVANSDSVVTAIGKLDNALKTADTSHAKLDTDNTFTGENTFNNANGIVIQDGSAGNSTRLTATSNGLTVSRTVEATGFKISGSANNVTSIDTTGAAVTDAAANANVMATGATVYNGAENAKYDGTLVKGDTTSTTIKQAMTATAGALNNVLTTAGTEVDSAKVDVQWNGADNTLSGVLGTGAYTSTNNVAAGDSVTTAISSLDQTIGGAITSTGVLSGVTLGSASGETSVAAALGTVSDTIGKTTSAYAAGTALAGATIGQGAASDISVVDALGTLNTALKTTNDTIGAGTLGDGTAGTIAGVAGDLNGKTIGASYSVTQAIADLNATNQNQNGSMSTLAGLINGQTVGSDGKLSGTATTLATGFSATNLTAAANELLTDITVTTAGNYISTGANVAANLGTLDTQVKANADAISGQDAKITSLGTNIGGTWSGNTFTHSNYNSNQNNILNTDDLTTAIGKLDDAMGKVSTISVTGNTGSTVVSAINQLNNNFTNGTIDAVFDDTTVTTLTVGSANAISGATSGELNMGNNKLTNIAGATFVNGTANANLNADSAGNLVTDSKFIAQSLDIGTTGKGFDASGNAKTGTLQIGDANAITGTATSLNMNGNDLTNIKDLSATGNATIGGNAVVTGTLTAGATTISADSTVSGTPASALAVTATNSVDGTSTSFSVTSDGVGIVGDTVMRGDLTITNGTNGFTLSSDTVSVHTLEGTTDTAHPVLNVSGDTFVNGMVASTDGLGVFKYDTTAGRYEEVFDVDDTGSIKSDMLKTDNTGNTVALGKDTSTVTTMNGSLKFNTGSESVNAIDAGTTAQTTGGANTMATVATVLKSAENATFTLSGATGSNITGPQTINTAIDTLDTKMGDVSTLAVNGYSNTTPPPAAMDIVSAVNKIDSNMNTVLGGIYKSDGSYDATQLAADGFTTQANLTASLKDYAANVEAATGGTFSGTTWSGNVVTTTSVDYAYGTTANDIMSAVSQVASNVGDTTGLDSIAARTAIAGNNGVASTQTVNANINALNATIGDLNGLNTTLGNLTNGGTTTPATVVTALNNIDATLGTIHGLSTKLGDAGNYGNLAVGTTVEDHLTQINASIGNRVSGFSTDKAVDYADSALNNQDIVTAISQVASNVGTAADLAYTYNDVATSNTVNANISNMNSVIGDVSQLSTTHYVANTTNLTDAVKVLDHNMERIDDDLKDLHHQHRSGMASMAAMSALVPNARSTGNTSISLGTGAYQGHTAVAFGGFHYLTDNLLLNAGAAWGNSEDVVYRVGITYSF